MIRAVEQGPIPAELAAEHGWAAATVYEVMHRLANPRGGGDGALTHEQYAALVLLGPGLAAQYREEVAGSGTLGEVGYGRRVQQAAAATGAAGASLHGHQGPSCGHGHAGAGCVHSPAGDDLDWGALTRWEALCLAEKPTRVFLAGEAGIACERTR